MARVRSEEKRLAILAAATGIIVEAGLPATRTAAIAKAAGVAEGTLFVYFKTKDELVNQLYLSIKQELAAVMITTADDSLSMEAKFRHYWCKYVCWGVENHSKKLAMDQLMVSAALLPEVKEQANVPFAEVANYVAGCIEAGLLKSLPVDYVLGVFAAMAEMTINYVLQQKVAVEEYQQTGFDLLWDAVAKR